MELVTFGSIALSHICSRSE